MKREEIYKDIMKYQTLIKTHTASIETCKKKIVALRRGFI